MRIHNRYLVYLFLLPAILIFLAFGAYPTIDAVITSFTKYSLTDPAAGKRFIGLDNYVSIVQNFRFWKALWRSLVFIVFSVALSFFTGFWIACLLNKASGKPKSFFSTVFLIPMAIAPAITSLNFKFMYNQDFGVINYLLELLNLGKQPFLGEPDLVLWAIIAVDIWQWTPLVILIMLAGLESLPQEPFEAAMLDGANRWQVLGYITFPLVKRFTIVTLVLRTVDAFRAYDKFALMTAGGPGTSSETLSLYIAKVGFTWFDIGHASALAFIALNLSALIAILFVRYSKAFTAG